jgi:hypothetical protein
MGAEALRAAVINNGISNVFKSGIADGPLRVWARGSAVP